MKLVNAKHRKVESNVQQQVYIVITGYDNEAIGYQWFDHYPNGGWLSGLPYERPQEIQFEGVKFYIFDWLPLKPNGAYQAVMIDALYKVGLT